MNYSIPLPTHNIIVRTLSVDKNDSKTFSICCTDLNSDQLRSLLQAFVVEDLLKRQIVTFADQPASKNSHNIMVWPKNRNEPVKCFGVRLHAHSSLEISRELHKFLCDGQCPF